MRNEGSRLLDKPELCQWKCLKMLGCLTEEILHHSEAPVHDGRRFWKLILKWVVVTNFPNVVTNYPKILADFPKLVTKCFEGILLQGFGAISAFLAHPPYRNDTKMRPFSTSTFGTDHVMLPRLQDLVVKFFPLFCARSGREMFHQWEFCRGRLDYNCTSNICQV